VFIIIKREKGRRMGGERERERERERVFHIE